MKHLEELLELLESELRSQGIETTESQRALLARHLQLLETANKRLNLTRLGDLSEMVRLHTVDSLTVLEDVGLCPEGPLLDIGSGGGFPGIPLAMCSGRSVVMIDSVKKKSREIQLMIDELGIGDWASVEGVRAETIASQRAQQFAIVTARAVSSLPALVELAAPLLADGGRLLAMKGNPADEEVARGTAVGKIVGMRPLYVRRFELAGGGEHRAVACYVKSGQAAIRLPRREGKAQHDPLA